MQKSENVLKKILHYSEYTAKGITGKEKGNRPGKHTMFHPKTKENIKQQINEPPIWQTKKRKTHP